MAKPKKPATSTSAIPVAKPPAPKPTRPVPATVSVSPLPNGKMSAARSDAKVMGEDQVRLRAYLKWEAAGKPPGDGAAFWLEAERELLPSKMELQKRTSL
jgi:hypothetical protein